MSGMPPQISNYPRGNTLLEDHFLLKRHLMKMVGGRYTITTLDGRFAMVADRKGFKLKEEIRVFGDEAMTQPMFGIFARQIMDFSAAYDVVDLATNQRIGALKRKGFHSMFRDEWVVMDATDREFGTIIEDSMLLAVVRRFLTNLVPQNYDCLVNGQKYVDFRQTFNPFNYNLHVDFLVPVANFDRRLGMAAAILLAAIEGKQRG